ncbi:MAG: mechanosensitive ion channel [Proteobacteria bacterium]|nr:mechanosensitive ion channel [Pseudomonadota bacterium]
MNQPARNFFVNLLQSNSSWRIFCFALFAVLLLGTLLSVFTRSTLIGDDAASRPRIAVVGPLKQLEGRALKQGAAMFVENLNRTGGYQGRRLELVEFEEDDKAAAAIIADARIIGALGYLNPTLLAAAANQLAPKKIPLVTPLHFAEPIPGVVSLGMDRKEQGRFVANYARNIVQQRLMYVIREAGEDFDPLVDTFVDVYKRFDTPVRKIWTIAPQANGDAEIADAIKSISELGIGAVYIATNPQLAAKVVNSIKASGNSVEFFGPSQLAGQSFLEELKRIAGKQASIQSHGLVTATPVLFDTANDEAQQFRIRYQQAYGVSPDWLATVAHDAAKVVLAATAGASETNGLTGALPFSGGRVELPIQMGSYNGDNLISAPVQLLPIAKGAGFDYIEALRQGRVLFVNDRFMYKTNVVYVGVTVHDISDLDTQKETATLDLSLWFRYRGAFSPQEVTIANALEPVVLDKPEESKESDELNYRRYRVKQKFKLNFIKGVRAFDRHIVGISFRHRLLNRNNLTYVVDVLGMPTGRDLGADLLQRNVLKPNSGWQVSNAWISQDLLRERGNGAPQYVGMTGEQPLYSNITLGIQVKPGLANVRDFISPEYFIYLAIFGLVGFGVAALMERRRWSRYWALHSWLFRVIFWQVLLVAIGNLILDWSFANTAPATTNTLMLTYESLWWLLGAFLVDMAIRRFIWSPLEQSTQRKIPNVMKFFVTVLLFALAFAGILAFVFNQTLTSLLATSGVLAMVIGLAIQANIANVFSGIILNIERPFKVGDYIRMNNIVGRVIDITWRTTRVESNDGQTLSLANSKVSEALMENLSEVPHGIAAETTFHTAPDVDPAIVLPILNAAVAQARAITFKDDPVVGPTVRYRGIASVEGNWVGQYSVGYRVSIMPKKATAREQLWTYVRQNFVELGINLDPMKP